MSDLIDRQAAIMQVKNIRYDADIRADKAIDDVIYALEQMPSAQPDVPDTNVGDINKFIDELEEIFAGQRERHVDDSVCGLCEYDGAYIGQSGDWCNECPGFDRDDCFKLSDKYRKEWIDTIANSLPSAQPDRSLWFRIGEVCVHESKGDIPAEVAIEKIRALLRAERRGE